MGNRAVEGSQCVGAATGMRSLPDSTAPLRARLCSGAEFSATFDTNLMSRYLRSQLGAAGAGVSRRQDLDDFGQDLAAGIKESVLAAIEQASSAGLESLAD